MGELFSLNPSSDRVSKQMSRLGTRDTAPELALRSELHRRGLRFRVDRAPLKGLRSRADLVFPSTKTAVYVDGCFWHACPEHGTVPKSNAEFWRRKLDRNRQRDAQIAQVLSENGWTAIRIWEHEDPKAAADRVEAAIKKRRDLYCK